MRLNLARPRNAQTFGGVFETFRTGRPVRKGPPGGAYATFRSAYSAISIIGGRSSVSTE
jgi:hypothetical protein